MYYNPNPKGQHVGDCAVRATAAALNWTWGEAYAALCAEGYHQKDLPNSNAVWGALLLRHGFTKDCLPNSCLEGYTVENFAHDHPEGTCVLALSGHVVCVRDGDPMDSWDSSDETVLYYFHREGGEERDI